MPLFDFTTDYLVLDTTEAVAYFRRTGSQTFDAGTAVANALRLDVTKDEKQNTALSYLIDVRWLIYKAQVGATEPKVNDVVQDAGGKRWTVTKVEVDAICQSYWLDSVREK